MRLRALILCVGLLLAAGDAAMAQGQFDDLLRRIPASANALMAIDVEAVFASPIAVKEGWKNQHEAEYVKKPMVLPPEADLMLLATQMNPNRDFEQNWELSVMHLTDPIGMRSVARAEGGYVDQINGLSAAWTPSDAYFVSPENRVMGVMNPANRQAVSRWADFSKTNRTPIVSAYLRNATAAVGKQNQVVMAVDLKDIVRPHKLDEALTEAPETKDNAALRETVRKVVMSLEGATLKVQLADKVSGVLEVNFAEDPTPIGKDAKKLILETMNALGASIEDLSSWRAAVRTNAIVLEGELSKPGMRKVFSLLELPTGKFSSLKGAEPAPDNFEVVAKASKAYYQSVSTLLDDLSKEFQTNRDARRNNAPVFLERYGRKIDRLPILNVDPELLGFGASVSETLRGMSNVQRTGGVRAGVRKSSTYGAYNYSYDGYGYADVRSTSSVRSQIDAQEQGKARVKRFESWKQIEDDLSYIRKQMTEKYQIEF